MMGKLNIWLLILVVVFLASWYFGRGDYVNLFDGEDSPVEEEAVEEPDWTEDPAETPLVHLKVLNGTDVPGLARDFSLLLGRTGCVAESVGNAPHGRYERTMLVNRRLEPARSRALARLFGDVVLVEEWDDRAGEDAVLVLGADHSRVASRLETAAARELEESRK